MIARLQGVLPNHKTIADFRKDNGTAIRQVCARFVALCRTMGLLTQTNVAIDGSKFKAVNNRDRNFTRAKMERRTAQIEESVARYLQQLDTADRQEPTEALKAKTSGLKEKIEKLREQMRRLQKFQGANALHAGPAYLADRPRCQLDGNQRPRLRRGGLQRPDCRGEFNRSTQHPSLERTDCWCRSNFSIKSQDIRHRSRSFERLRRYPSILAALSALSARCLQLRHEPCPCTSLHMHAIPTWRIGVKGCCVDRLSSTRRDRTSSDRDA